MRCNEVLIFKYTLSAIAFGVMTYFITACLRLYFSKNSLIDQLNKKNESNSFLLIKIILLKLELLLVLIGRKHFLLLQSAVEILFDMINSYSLFLIILE